MYYHLNSNLRKALLGSRQHHNDPEETVSLEHIRGRELDTATILAAYLR
jgi:hypothetical protein